MNPHTFLSISASIAQVNNIARELGKLDPANAKTYTQNARAYGKRLRQMRADALAKLTKAPNADLRVATVHAAYDYLLREFGLEVTAVVEPGPTAGLSRARANWKRPSTNCANWTSR